MLACDNTVVERYMEQIQSILQKTNINYAGSDMPHIGVIMVGSGIKNKDNPELKAKFCELLGYADITNGFRKYIWGNFNTSVAFGLPLNSSLPSAHIRADDYAIFDKIRARDYEEKALKAAIEAEAATFIPGKRENLFSWIDEFEEIYGPLHDSEIYRAILAWGHQLSN